MCVMVCWCFSWLRILFLLLMMVMIVSWCWICWCRLCLNWYVGRIGCISLSCVLVWW